jgi:hypothetical protein
MARPRQQVRRDLMRPDDLHSERFDRHGERAQHAVVALGQCGERAGQKLEQ